MDTGYIADFEGVYMSIKEKIKVVENGDNVEVWLPLCRRIAGELKCEEKGIRVIYRKRSEGFEGPVRVIRPIGNQRIVRTLIYEPNTVGPVEVREEG